MASGRDLVALEARLRSILVPYDDRLEHATIYGLPVLRRAGAGAHEWFAFVKAASHHVSFFLLPVHTFPELRAGLSPALRKRLTGQASFNFKAIDETELAELESLVARAYERYIAGASPDLPVA